MILLGLVFASFIVYYNKINRFDEIEASQNNNIIRQKKSKSTLFPFVGLLNEYKSAIATLVLLNGLLFLVNTLDIWKVWFNFSFEKNLNLSKELHKGVYLLILSILMSIGVLVYFFRQNINFLQNNSKLKNLSYVWIIQNTILVITVIVKCFYYIHYHGLAYKRIGVLIFVIVVLFGLTLMFIKIKNKKSVHFLLRKTTWFSYIFLLVCSAINWDMLITDKNLNHSYPKNISIDYSFILSLSNQTIPYLIQNEKLLIQNNNYCNENYHVAQNHKYQLLTDLRDEKIARFKHQQKKYTWLSWNYADAKTNDFLNNLKSKNNAKN
jgi:hypothetical protein